MPADGAHGVGPGTPVEVVYSRPPGPLPAPTILPATPGSWSWAAPGRRVFKPAGYWMPGTVYTVSVPLPGGTPAADPVIRFRTALPPTMLLQQYLAMLGYLPLRFVPSGDLPNRRAVLQVEPASPDLVGQTSLDGTFSWAYPGVPGTLSSLWHPGQPNMLTNGAILQFEQAEGLATDGDAGPLMWEALLRAVAARRADPAPYNYVVISESLPETLTVWQDGKDVYSTPVNTGAPGSATPQGTWPVVFKQDPNLMKGCEPDGSCYQVWVRYASYFLPSVGDAIHAYPRYSYGYPQSNGCVEVEPSQGQVVYGYDPVGTLVTVTS